MMAMVGGKILTSRQGEDGRANIAAPMPIVLAGEREYVYAVMDDFSSRGVYKVATPESAVEVFKAFRVAAENKSEKRITEITRS